MKTDSTIMMTGRMPAIRLQHASGHRVTQTLYRHGGTAPITRPASPRALWALALLLLAFGAARGQTHVQAAALPGPEGIWLFWSMPSAEATGAIVHRRAPIDTGFRRLTPQPIHRAATAADLELLPGRVIDNLVRYVGLHDRQSLLARIAAGDRGVTGTLALDRHARRLLGASFIDATASDTGDYLYRVDFITTAGAVIAQSDTLTASTRSMPWVRPPDSVWAEVHPSGILVHWQPASGMDAAFAHQVWRAPVGSDDWHPLTLLPRVTLFDGDVPRAMSLLDTTVAGSVHYAVSAVDYAGNRSDMVPMRQPSIHRAPTEPPAITFDAVTGSDEGIVLTWNAPVLYEAEHVEIGRRAALDSVWTTLTAAWTPIIGRNTYTDRGAIPGRFYQYRIRRFDQDVPSIWTHSRLEARREDLDMQDLTLWAEADDERIAIRWRIDSLRDDIVSWRIERAETEAGPWGLISPRLDRGTRAFDEKPPAGMEGRTQWYRIRGVDARGIETPPSDAIAVRIPGLPAPVSTPVVTAIRHAGRVDVVWSRPAESVAAGTWIGLRRSGVVDETVATVADTVFTASIPLTAAMSGAQVVLAFVNPLGARGPASAPIDLMVEDADTPEQPVGLFGMEENGTVELRWSASDTSRTTRFRIYSSPDGETWTLLREIPATGDPALREAMTTDLRWYAVSAVGAQGSESARSTAVLVRR